MNHLWTDVGTVLGVLLALLSVLTLIGKWASRVFGNGVKAHVVPLVTQLSDSLNHMSRTISDVQKDHAFTAERFALDLKTKEETLYEHDEKLNGHSEALADHSTRIAVVEVRLNNDH